MPVDRFGRMSDAKTRDTGVSLTYINNNYNRSDGGTPVSGSINMNGNTLYNVSDPVSPQDVATKEYADTTNKAFVLFEGKYLAVGDLSMGGRRLNNVGMPIENHQASNKLVIFFKVNPLKSISETSVNAPLGSFVMAPPLST